MAAKVFISGASGFIGSVLAARYRSQETEVLGVDLRADPDHGVVAGDIAVEGDWQHHADGCDLVIHTAAVVGFAQDPADTWRTNVLGTRRMLDAAARGGAQRFVHFSSITVFGFEYPDGADERWPVRLTGDPYPDTKIASEEVVLAAHVAGDVPCTIVRPGDVYGPRSRGWTVLPVQMIKSGQMLLPADGEITPVYVENLVDGVMLAADSETAAGEIFTITDGRAVATREFFGRYASMLGKPPIRTIPTVAAKPFAAITGAALRTFGQDTELSAASLAYISRRGTYSIEKARRVLGYEPAIDLDEGMRRSEEWLRSEGLL
jgi:nucleoside-diphosphate-sugar epimerase